MAIFWAPCERYNIDVELKEYKNNSVLGCCVIHGNKNRDMENNCADRNSQRYFIMYSLCCVFVAESRKQTHAQAHQSCVRQEN